VFAVVTPSVRRSKVGPFIRSAIPQCLYVFCCYVCLAIESKSADTTRYSVVPSKVDNSLTIADVVRITILRINWFVWYQSMTVITQCITTWLTTLTT
jgi:hypothetical protein